MLCCIFTPTPAFLFFTIVMQRRQCQNVGSNKPDIIIYIGVRYDYIEGITLSLYLDYV